MPPLHYMLGQKADVSGSKSTAINPLLWILLMLVTALLSSLRFGLPSWVGVGLGTCVAIDLAATLVAYFYFMLTNVDALRSERYSLSKMAMEKGLVGDDVAGVFPGDAGAILPPRPSLPPTRRALREGES